MLKLLKNESLYSKIRIGYIITVILYSLARQNVTALQPYLMSDILNLAVIGVAGLLVAWDVFIFRNIWKTKYIWVLAGFAVLTVISSVAGFKYGYIENVKALANLFIQFCLLFVVSLKKDRKGLEKEMRVIGNGISAAWFVAALISVFMYFADITYTANRYLWGDTIEIVQGFVREHGGVVVMRLWGIFVDPNFAAATSIAIICVSLFVLFTSKKKAEKAFHIINVFVQYLYIVLSNSRMGLLILCLAVLVGAWYYAALLFRKKEIHFILKEILAVVLAVVCTAACYGSVLVTKAVLPYVRYAVTFVTEEMFSEEETTAEETTTEEVIETTTEEEETGEQETTEEITTEEATTEEATTEEPTSNVIENLNRQDVVVKSDVSNGRFSLWMEGLKSVFKEYPILGVGPRNYHSAANEIDPELRIATGYSIHNSFIELLMGNGITGTLVLLVFLLLCAKDAVAVRYKKPEKAKGVGILMTAVLSLLACGMFIACLFYTLSGATVILFTCLGYAVRLTADLDGDTEE